jgi:hypothetical protein
MGPARPGLVWTEVDNVSCLLLQGGESPILLPDTTTAALDHLFNKGNADVPAMLHCDLCDESFSRSDSLKIHIRMYTVYCREAIHMQPM